MATTTPDNIYSPDAGQQYALTQDLLAMADSVQDALLTRGTTLSGAGAPSSGLTAPDGTLYVDTSSGLLYLKISGSWSRFMRTTGGGFNGITDSLGELTIPHGLGVAPTSVTVTISTDTPLIGHMLTSTVRDFTATTFKARIYRQDTHTTFSSNSVLVYWMAVG